MLLLTLAFYDSTTTAIASHRVALALYIHPTYVHVPAVVAVGSVTPAGAKAASHVNVLDVPLSFIANSSLLPTTGVPVGALIVRLAARAV